MIVNGTYRSFALFSVLLFLQLFDSGSATVCPTGLSDWSDRQSDVACVGPTGRSDDRTV